MSTGGWIHIPDEQEPLPPAEPKRRGGRGKLTTAQRTEILQRWRGGEKQTALAKEYGVSVAAVSQIVKKTAHPATTERPQEAQSEPERPRKAQKALTPAWLRERAVQRARELQNDVAMQNKRIEEAQREKEKAEKALHELHAWLEEN